MKSFLLKSRCIVMPDRIADGYIHVEGETIAGVIPADAPHPDLPVEDAGACPVLPGLVDPHVHINEPGRTEWEGFASATASAAAGGVTTLVDMPLNSDPVTTTRDALTEKLRAADGKLAVDCAFHGGLVPGGLDALEALLDAGVTGIKAFMTYSGIPEFPAASADDLYAAMPLLAKRGVPLLAHAEIETPVRLPEGPDTSYARYLASRPPAWETDAIALLIRACRDTGCAVHIVHLACADALPMIAAAREEGLPLTVETCPHYLHLEAETIPDGATQFKCAPPVRGREHREALWQALQDGVIDMIASDHSPCPPEMKRLDTGDFFKAWGGIASLQLGLSIIHTEARRRHIALSRVAEWMAGAPARIFGLSPAKGRIVPGADADLVIFDPDRAIKVDAHALRHRHPCCPYHDESLVGAVQRTYLRGRCVYDTNRQDGVRSGRIILRKQEPRGGIP